MLKTGENYRNKGMIAAVKAGSKRQKNLLKTNPKDEGVHQREESATMIQSGYLRRSSEVKERVHP